MHASGAAAWLLAGVLLLACAPLQAIDSAAATGDEPGEDTVSAQPESRARRLVRSEGCGQPAPQQPEIPGDCRLALIVANCSGAREANLRACERCAVAHADELALAGCTPLAVGTYCFRLGSVSDPRYQQVHVADPLLEPPQTRSYLLHLPDDYDPQKPYPIVMDFHGYYFTALIDVMFTGWSAVGNDHDFIVVYPQGASDTAEVGDDGLVGTAFGSWNALGTGEGYRPREAGGGRFTDTCDMEPNPNLGRNRTSYPYSCYKSCLNLHGCTDTSETGALRCDSSTCMDDMLFVQRLLDRIEQTVCVDLDRVHATGISNGAMMVYALALSPLFSHRLASIAPVAGGALNGFLPERGFAMSVMDIHGTCVTRDPLSI